MSFFVETLLILAHVIRGRHHFHTFHVVYKQVSYIAFLVSLYSHYHPVRNTATEVKYLLVERSTLLNLFGVRSSKQSFLGSIEHFVTKVTVLHCKGGSTPHKMSLVMVWACITTEWESLSHVFRQGVVRVLSSLSINCSPQEIFYKFMNFLLLVNYNPFHHIAWPTKQVKLALWSWFIWYNVSLHLRRATSCNIIYMTCDRKFGVKTKEGE